MELNAVQEMQWRMHVTKDDGLNGMEAFALLVPSDWTVSGGTYWQMSPVMPCLVNLRVVGRHGQKFEALPSMAFSCGMGTWMFGPISSPAPTLCLTPACRPVTQWIFMPAWSITNWDTRSTRNSCGV